MTREVEASGVRRKKSGKKNIFYLLASVVAVVAGIGLLAHSFSGSGNNVRGDVGPTGSETIPETQFPEESDEPLRYNDPDSELIETFIEADNKNRRFNIFVPGSYIRGNEAVPLVFAWHGLTQTAEGMQRMLRMDEVAERENFIIVYPAGLGNSFDIFRIEGNYDLMLTEEMLKYMKSEFRIKDSSVYSTGMSNGGFMSTLIACEFSTQFAAVAPIAATFAANVMNKCSPTAVVPIIEFHGTRDTVIPIDGSIAFESVDDTINFWAINNGQQTPPVITEIRDRVLFYDFKPDSIVQHYRYIGASHISVVTRFTAQDIIDFFKSVSDF